MFFVVLLAMVAGFLALRLYNVLGKRSGHEQQPLPRAAEDRVVSPPVPRTTETTGEPRQPANRNIDAIAENGLRAIVAGEPSFDVTQFVTGAQAAYRMVLEAYWRGDEAALAELVDPEIRAAFGSAIEARRAAGEVLDNRLVAIERTMIVDAAVSGRDARITVRFDADIAAVTRDVDGNVVAGSLTDAVPTHDLWTFARTLKSNDPNWTLADTDEA